MSLNTLDLLKKLSNVYGPPGREREVREIFKEAVKGLVDEVFEDASGNLVAKKYGDQKSATVSTNKSAKKGTVLFSAHTDEVCCVVSRVLPEGFLRVEGIGIDPKLLPSQKVWVYTRSGARLRGVVGTLAPHLQTEETRKVVNGFDQLFVDVSMYDSAEVSTNEAKISVGDFVIFDQEPFTIGDFYYGKSMDDRACGVIAVKALEKLGSMKFDFDVVAVFSSREEVGAFGARTASYAYQPDIGIALDVTHAQDSSPNYTKNELGKGPVIGVGAVIHKKISQRLIEVAKENGIPYQIEPNPSRTGTDGDVIQLEGVATGLICLPLRYMHNPYEQIHLKDIEEASRLLALFVSSLKEGVV